MGTELVNESGIPVDEADLVRQAAFVLDRLRIHPQAELSVVLTDPRTMTGLHERWMHEPGPTDVLSFPMEDIRPGQVVDSRMEGLLGDVVICPQVAEEQAVRAGHGTRHELGVLLTHGILHLLGYDHEDLADERLMFGLQGRLVSEWEAREPESSGPGSTVGGEE